jgi:hypothetical protein
MKDVRVVQGWRTEDAKDASLKGRIWKEHLDLAGINPKLYPTLLAMVVNRRAKEYYGKQPGPIEVSMLISCYYEYKSRKIEEYKAINHQLEYYRNLQHQYATKQISLESAARQAKFHEGIGDTEFLIKSGEVISRLRDKSDRFMEENYLV